LKAYLIYVGTLYLAHGYEVVCQKITVVDADSANFREALVGEEGKFFSGGLQVLGLLREHEFVSLVLVLEELFGSAE